MILYKFGKVEVKMSFQDFLSITYKGNVKYKSDFKEFSELYEFIEKNKNQITNLLFDGYEYILDNGLLHNLIGPAIIKYCDDKTAYFQGTSRKFYIDGKLVHDTLDNRGVKRLEDFLTKEIFFLEEITGKYTERDPDTKKIIYRRREGVDYKRHIINLKQKMRKEKLKKLNDY